MMVAQYWTFLICVRYVAAEPRSATYAERGSAATFLKSVQKYPVVW